MHSCGKHSERSINIQIDMVIRITVCHVLVKYNAIFFAMLLNELSSGYPPATDPAK